MLAGRHLSSGRDVERGGGAERTAAARTVRGTASETGAEGGARAGDGAERIASAVSQYARGARGEIGRGASGERGPERSAGSADRRDLPGEPDGERADLDAGSAGAMRSRGADLLFFVG